MTSAATLQLELLTIQTDERFTEAVLTLRDDSQLCFCHRVGERWAKAVNPGERQREQNPGRQPSLAECLLAGMALFRLNAKHLDIQFADGSRWEKSFMDRTEPGASQQ